MKNVTEERSRRWKVLQCLRVGKINIVKQSSYPKQFIDLNYGVRFYVKVLYLIGVEFGVR